MAINVEVEGDYCGDCPLVQKKTKAFYCTAGEENIRLVSRKKDLYRPEGYVAKRLLDKRPEPMRSAECRRKYPSTQGLYRQCPKNKRLFPTVPELADGEFVTCSKYLDLAPLAAAAPRSKIAALFGYNEEMPTTFFKFRYCTVTYDLGNTAELNLSALPTAKGRTAFFLWAQQLQNEICDAEENFLFHIWMNRQER